MTKQEAWNYLERQYIAYVEHKANAYHFRQALDTLKPPPDEPQYEGEFQLLWKTIAEDRLQIADLNRQVADLQDYRNTGDLPACDLRAAWLKIAELDNKLTRHLLSLGDLESRVEFLEANAQLKKYADKPATIKPEFVVPKPDDTRPYPYNQTR